MSRDPLESSRREFLSGKAIRQHAERAGEELADRLTAGTPATGAQLRLNTTAMACEFDVILNPGPPQQLGAASDALDLVHRLEDQMSVYRADSQLSRLNRAAPDGPVPVESKLFALLRQAVALCGETGGAFDPTTGPLIALWRRCRREDRLPDAAEVAAALEQTGTHQVRFDDASETVTYDRTGVELNLGGIGKGHALDRAAAVMAEYEVRDWLLHGGHSSILASGSHSGHDGWPVGIRNPLFPERRLMTVRLRDRALGTSGSGVQFFRHGGKRYGHVLDPRTGWPVEGLLSVSVLAPTAAEADALSTAFFVMGLENALEFCDNHQEISAILIPPPRRGRTLEPLLRGVPEDTVLFTPDETGA